MASALANNLSILRSGPKSRSRSERVRAVYSQLAEEFSQWTPSAFFQAIFQQSVMAEIHRRCADQSDRLRILEVGCGHGTWAKQIFDAAPQLAERLSYQGIDFAEPRIRLAQQLMANHPSMSFTAANADTWQPQGSFDLILAIEIISHTNSTHCCAWLEKWTSWLNPGGSVVLLDKDKSTGHAWKLRWDRFKRRHVPRILRGASYYFPEHFGELLDTLDYPSFAGLSDAAGGLGYRPRPIIRLDAFRALILDANRGQD